MLYKRLLALALLESPPQQRYARFNSTPSITDHQRAMDIRRSHHAEADRLATVAILFLEKYSGTYRTRSALRAQVGIYLDNEYPHDLKWLNRVKDMEGLVDLVKNAGGVVIVELPPLPGKGAKVAKTAEAKGEKERK